jgi:hypothetical protein
MQQCCTCARWGYRLIAMEDAAHYSDAKDFVEAVEFLFWAWGQDLQLRKRETFLQFGFQRFHDPQQQGAKSMYWRHSEHGGFGCLWAFGMLRVIPGRASYVYKRGELRPWVLPPIRPPHAYIPVEELKDMRIGRAPLSMLKEAAGALLSFGMEYEDWVNQVFGSEFREVCFSKWRKTCHHQRFQDLRSLRRCLSKMQKWAVEKGAPHSISPSILSVPSI